MQFPTANYCLKLSIDVQSYTQLVPTFLLHVSVQELHNIIVSPSEEVLLNEEIDAYNNISISDSTLRNILPPQMKKVTALYKLMCGCECCISAKSINSSLLTYRYFHMKHIKEIIFNA